MSRQTALDNIWLKPSARWGHTEYSLGYHTAYLARKTGLKPDDPNLVRTAQDLFGFDFMFGTHDGLVDWIKTGRVTDMGHAVYAADGSDQRQPAVSPFRSEEEVWAFDAVKEYGLPDFDDAVREYERCLKLWREIYPNQLMTGGYYKTIVSGAIQSFGWDMLLTAAADPDRMERVFDSFFRRTLFHMEAWAKTSAEVIIQHDDFVWTCGPFLSPDYYRKVFISRYAELWKPLHAAGKKVLFCSDGLYTMFMKDLAAAGADGFIFEPCNDFEFIADRFGKTKCLVGSYVDCVDLTFGRWDKVRADIDRTIARLADCRGAVFSVGNHMPANIPEAMMDRFFDYLLPKLERKSA